LKTVQDRDMVTMED